MSAIIKDPIEVFDLSLDWSKANIAGISTSTWEFTNAATLVTEDLPTVGLLTSVRISGGTLDTWVDVRNVITTPAGETFVMRLPSIHVSRK